MEYKGELVRWNDERGFGFIKSPSSEEKFFIHITALKAMPRRPVVGDIIYFQVERGEDGKARAKSARIEGLAKTTGKTRPKKGGNGYLLIFGLWVVFLVLVLVSVSFFVYYRSVEEDLSGYKCGEKQYCRTSSQCFALPEKNSRRCYRYSLSQSYTKYGRDNQAG